MAAEGLLTQDQTTAILAAEHARAPRPPAPTRPVSVMAELLGYLGGILAIIGAVLLAARFWQDLASWTRLTLLGLVAAALWAAGAMVHEHADPALWRLRGVLWLLSSGAVAFFAALFAAEVLAATCRGRLAGGGMVLVFGAQAMAAGWEAAGLVLGLASAAGLLVAGTTARRLVVAGVGIFGVVMFLPATVMYFFAGTVGVPLLILLAGVVLLTITLVLLGVRLPWSRAATPTPSKERPAERSNRPDSITGPMRPEVRKKEGCQR
jgi:hypothetical protein